MQKKARLPPREPGNSQGERRLLLSRDSRPCIAAFCDSRPCIAVFCRKSHFLPTQVSMTEWGNASTVPLGYERRNTCRAIFRKDRVLHYLHFFRFSDARPARRVGEDGRPFLRQACWNSVQIAGRFAKNPMSHRGGPLRYHAGWAEEWGESMRADDRRDKERCGG
jgi:hypothetical protein